MRFAINFRKPFVALEEALIAEGCELVRDCWKFQQGETLVSIDAWIIDFCDGARNLWRTYRLASTLRKAKLPLIGIDRDAPWFKGVRKRRILAMEWLRPLDIYATHSLQSAERFGHALYLPNAAWTSVYSLRGRSLESFRNPLSYDYEVSFLGNIDAKRYPEHRERLRFLVELRFRLAEKGVHLELFDSTQMPLSRQVEVIQSSKINLNYGAAADCAGERSWGLPERCYGIPACGGFMLSDYREHAAQDFVRDREWVDFSDIQDCIDKIHRFLSDFDKLRDVAEAAHRRVMSQHTYLHRARTLLSAVEGCKATIGKGH